MNRRAFSLIEVLIAIVVLSIGLLGLAMSMPATITIQRRGADATRAVTAALAARSYIESRPDLVRLHTWDATQGRPYPLPHERDSVGFGTLVEDSQWSESFEWDNTRSGEIETDVRNDDRGRMTFTMNGTTIPVYVGVGDRLWPDPSIGRRAEFVWDFIVRRMPARSASDAISPRIQIAVFVRRIDPGIRLREGLTLYQALTNQPNSVPPADRRVPVAVLDNRTNVLPTFDGKGDYALPFTLEVSYDDEFPDRITIRNEPSDSHLNVALKPGQKFVDNLGNVYRVMRVLLPDPQNPNTNTIIISPSVPDWVRSTDRTDPDTLFQIAMTPQTPVTIEVFELSLTDPLSSPNGSGVRGLPRLIP